MAEVESRATVWYAAAGAVADLIPVQQAVQEFGLHENTLYRWLSHGRLKRYKRPGAGHRTFVDRRELKQLTTPRLAPARRRG